jgi:hypothetical protein
MKISKVLILIVVLLASLIVVVALESNVKCYGGKSCYSDPIYGESPDSFATINLQPVTSPPSIASLGDLYVDSDSQELCFYNGFLWVGVSYGGICR